MSAFVWTMVGLYSWGAVISLIWFAAGEWPKQRKPLTSAGAVAVFIVEVAIVAWGTYVVTR